MTNGSLKIGLLAAAGALIVGAAAIGTALAQSGSGGPTAATTTGQPAPGGQRGQHQQVFELAASKLGVTPERLWQAFSEARQELGIQHRPGGPSRWRRGEIRERVRGMIQRGLEIVAGELHISVDQLRSELPGSSLGAVSRNHGVDPQVVANALTNAADQRIDAAQAEGRLTTDRAAKMKQHIGEMIQRMMDRQLPVRPAR